MRSNAVVEQGGAIEDTGSQHFPKDLLGHISLHRQLAPSGACARCDAPTTELQFLTCFFEFFNSRLVR